MTQSRSAGLYYGWRVLIALFLAGFMVYGGGLYSFVLFVVPLTREFHWNRAATGGLVTAFWLSAPLILLGGFGIKRFGATRMLIAGILLEATCVALLSTVSSFWQMYALRAAMGFGKIIFAVTLPYSVSRWFSRHYSFGLGITWAGWHVGGMVLAPVTGWIIAQFGWRVACLSIAVGLITIGLIPTLLTQRARSPRQLGLGLDGDPLGASADQALKPDLDDTPRGSLGDLLRAPLFWLLAVLTLLVYITYSGLLTHQGAIVEGAGFTAALASLVLGSTAGFAALGSLSVGWILDRASLRNVGVALCGLLLIGALSLLWVNRAHSAAALVSYASCFGFVIGGSDLYFVAFLRQRFPHVSVAYSYSAWYFCQILTLLLGGPAAGLIFDLTGNYDRTLGLLAGSAALALLLSLVIVRPAPAARAHR
jgi:MFS family permease